MDIVIPWLLAWAYPLIGVATTIYTARSYKRKNPKEDSGWAAGAGLLSGAGWPIGLLYWFTVNLLRKEEDQRKAVESKAMTLEVAQLVIATHEAELAGERRKRNDRLKRDWEKLAREALPKRGWNSARNQYDITDFNN